MFTCVILCVNSCTAICYCVTCFELEVFRKSVCDTGAEALEFALVEILFEQSFGIETGAHKRLSRKKTNKVCNRTPSLEKHGFVAKVANLYIVAENTALFSTTSGHINQDNTPSK